MKLTVAILILFSSVCAAAEDYPFGRLFTAPTERTQLDDLRKGIVPESEAQVVQQPLLQSLDASTTQIKFSGYVRRSDGSSVIWIDGKSDLTGDQEEVGRLLPDGNEAQFRSAEGEAKLKPGQTWHIEKGLVTDAYQAGPASSSTAENGDQTQ
ncbi:MAG: hypothetical protein JJ957_15020 [Pseudomonadales bacterium]|nr:hypothetical protein [Pseudomonadales bacterium]MBO6565945.1 hypothetical protein [Pseudomonadales bacterium]MBO6597094.1 hypothetical protein [Pseudomonadales bacterium]MBO6823719.1 hypothetical protein [Pseudomonadales bacterium]